ncbi:hypothetical protein ABZ154_03595 [Streptomyces sp. NPDC006261]|uniref:hypothetical protein n=1 Tax=Streptomyces sp. NPDC006261 TaxID=3156739 RepID=UPI0033B755C6
MAARKDTPNDLPEQSTPAATIRTQEYSAGTGWEVGQTAPEDAYRALDVSGSGEPTGPVVNKHPGGYARQIVTKGALVTAGVKRELDAAEAEQDGEG